MKKISILGSTGSIGQSTLDVVGRHPDKFKVVGLAEGHDVELLSQQIKRFGPRLVSVRDEKSANLLRNKLGSEGPEIVFGLNGATLVASMDDVNLVVSAIVGAAGLTPTMAAIKKGKTIALANKEAMVVAGRVVCREAKKSGSKILPVDSEHSAIFQSLVGHRKEDVAKIILTASGGPFLRTEAKELARVTPEMALKHPRWSMGAKITIDSATLMNKGLEVIEARWLFDVPPSIIDVVVHPQSIIHSMVEYVDGCVMAELGEPDMRAPISYAITYPERATSGVKTLNLAEIGNLTFEKPDFGKFPCLKLAYQALEVGGGAPAVINAANEIAVAAFIEKKIGFLDIARVATEALNSKLVREFNTIEEVIEIDMLAREFAREWIDKL